MIDQQGGQIQTWLSYAPLLYHHLLFNFAHNLNSINSVRWIRGVTNIKSTFKFQQGFICITGTTGRSTMTGGNQGGFSLYKCSIPVDQQQDDDRVKPVIKLRSHWNFQQQIDLIQQYGNNLEDLQLNNMFAFSARNNSKIKLISTRKLLQQGVHTNTYIDNGCLKLDGHTQPITCIKWANLSTNSHKLFSSSQDSTIVQWDIQKMTLQRQMKFHRSSVQAITPLFNYSSSWSQGPVVNNVMTTLASASTDGYIFIWDNKSGLPVNKINPRQKQVYALDCISQYCLVSGGASGTIKVWDLRYTREYMYDQPNDKAIGHSGSIRSIKSLRIQQKLNENPQQFCKNFIGKIKFTSSDQYGKIIQWREKIQFIHDGHESACTFDLADNTKVCVSADKKKNMFMVWQPGVFMGPSQF